MSKQFDKLVTLLKELFQLDQPDLDFGLYRIMHAKADEITQFLETDLLPQVKEALSQYTTADKAGLQAELNKAIEQANALGVDPDTVAKVKELRQKIADESVDIGALENEVYDHLYSFFRRYYHEGDFLSKRVYKPGVYAIPYEGEEVKLHWANHDQYYIKTSEYLRDYAFTLKPNDANDLKRVHFRLVDAAEGEHGNVKAEEGKDRVFILAQEDFIALEGDELVIRFEYRPATMEDWLPEDRSAEEEKKKPKPPNQAYLMADAVSRLEGVTDPTLADWLDLLKQLHTKANGERADYSRVQAHLQRYVARNTFDYFIHKDLGGFLRRELDFYIKNEVMHLDDVENETAPRVEQYLSKIKVIRRIAHKLVDFLAQLEDFQKKLWLKKKFVVETNYCITLDRIPEEFYPEIAANEAQREEWVRLFAIDEIEASTLGPAYSEPLTVEFLKANNNLALDTAFFDKPFQQRIVTTIDNFDDQCDGTLIHSENFQALHLLGKKHVASIDCIYIDPPYNSPSSEIAYKNSYKHSSWLTLMENRIEAAKTLMSGACPCIIAIDENEQNGIVRIAMQAFPDFDITSVAIEHNKKGVQGRLFSYNHESAIFSLPPTLSSLNRTLLPEGEWEYSNLRNWGGESLRSDGKNCFYPIFVREQKVIGFGDVCEDDFHPESSNVSQDDGTIAIFPVDAEGIERKWRYAQDTVTSIQNLLRVEVARNGSLQVMKAKADAQFKTMWYDTRYNAGDHGTKVLTNMGFPKGLFDFPKSVNTVFDCIFAVSDNSASVLDYFAGSGTTAQAVIELNKSDGGKRTFILVEMGSYFDAVTKPRVLKSFYSRNWRSGKPEDRNNAVSHCLKYVRLESYEDTLNNLSRSRSESQQSVFDQNPAIKEDYLLRYMLDVETRGSQSLLNVQAFADPTAYKLKVKRPGSDESREVNVDLLETFNYLIGLTVQHIAAPKTFNASFKRSSEGRLEVDGRIKQDEAGPWWFRTVTGTTPEGKRTLVVWRKLTGDPEQDNLMLDEWFKAQNYSTRDYEFDLIYVNGDNNLENLCQPEDTWKVRLTEEDFHRLMFDTTGV